ncbi:hypothetical protein BJV78DRAFT_354450 [Lactifluus subvellereus]|nr:hypothetical protein BJV78DRAFT_354450 [Lactifluus subvellereus]
MSFDSCRPSTRVGISTREPRQGQGRESPFFSSHEEERSPRRQTSRDARAKALEAKKRRMNVVCINTYPARMGRMSRLSNAPAFSKLSGPLHSPSSSRHAACAGALGEEGAGREDRERRSRQRSGRAHVGLLSLESGVCVQRMIRRGEGIWVAIVCQSPGVTKQKTTGIFSQH